MRIIVHHANVGCDTGCTGHYIEVDGERKRFFYRHPDSNSEEDKLAFAKQLIAEEMGEEHVKDLDWENSFVVDD